MASLSTEIINNNDASATSFNSTTAPATVALLKSCNLRELRGRVLIGDLPPDFLRISFPSQCGEQGASDNNFVEEDGTNPSTVAAMATTTTTNGQQQVPMPYAFHHFIPPNTRGRLQVKITEAKLTKNYGIPGVRMDPYVRLRVGGVLFESPTCVNGGKNPFWNRTVNAYLPDGVESIYLQIFDERAFTPDECVAWAHVMLPQSIFSPAGEPIDEWYRLSGPQGDDKEGLINLVLSFTPIRQRMESAVPSGAEALQQQEQQLLQQLKILDEDVAELQAMFPDVMSDVVRSVLEASGGDKQRTAAALIEMTN